MGSVSELAAWWVSVAANASAMAAAPVAGAYGVVPAEREGQRVAVPVTRVAPERPRLLAAARGGAYGALARGIPVPSG
jgi:hypothetical protein